MVELTLTIISGYIFYSHPHHSGFFLAAFFHLPGSIIGMYVMEFLKSEISSFNILFTIFAAISILVQVLLLTGVISAFLRWKAVKPMSVFGNNRNT